MADVAAFPVLDLADIQGGVLRPRPTPYAATYILLRIDQRAAGRELLRRLSEVVTSAATADQPGRDTWVSVALTFAGLQALGVAQASLDSFTWEFRQGMAARASALGDVGENAPEHWEAPFGSNDIHIILVGVAPDAARLEAAVRRARDAFADLAGVVPIWRQDCYAPPDEKEPFGFRDGISHPAIEGSGVPGSNPFEVPLKAGELVLGYPDEMGGFPAAPQPDILGRNGSYVAFRKLHQKVALFRRYLRDNAGGSEDEEFLAAKMMGRWRSGAPLALCPLHDDPALGDDPARNNAFLYRADDATGYSTPPGSHVRRCNPRDAAVAGVVRLHRMIRRGTAYGPMLPQGVVEDDGADRGLMFAFVGAHLKRQFEFVQSEWINGGEFLGLGDARDPVCAAADGTGSYTIPRRPIPRRVHGLANFVTTRGGEYGFLPSLSALRWLAAMSDAGRGAVTEVVVIGAGPAGVMAALRAADLGARTTLVTSGPFGGMAANDGPVPVRTLAHAARLMRDARQLASYGVMVGEPVIDYGRLLGRVAEVVQEVGASSVLRGQLDAAGVIVREHEGAARFIGPHMIETARGRRLSADKIILCTGGVSRRLPIPGFELTATHSDAWSLAEVPPSMLVIGSGATGAQVASVFNAFGTKVQLFEAGPRILSTEEPEVSACVAAAFRRSGIVIHEAFGGIEAFEATPDGIRMNFTRHSVRRTAEAALAVVAVGWTADTAPLNLPCVGVETDRRGFIRADACQRTTASHVFAAGDVTGQRMLAPQALHAGFVAATNAVQGCTAPAAQPVNPVGSFTDPEYAQVGLGEVQARATHDVAVTTVGFDETTRAIIDGRTTGFCKLVVDRWSHRILGCHVVGERAVDVAQIATVAMAAGMKVGDLARLPFSFPTYAGILARAAATATRALNHGSDDAIASAGDVL